MTNAAALQKEQPLWIALDAMPVAVSWATLSDQKIIFMNRTFTEVFGYVVGDFENIPEWTEKYPVLEEREQAWARWKVYFDHPDDAELRIDPMEISVVCKDGTVKTTLHSGVVLPAAGWAVATFIDITQRKQNELLLRKAEERASQNEAIYRMLLEHSQEMVVLVSPDGLRRDVSPAVQQMLGWTPEEYLSYPIRSLIHPEDVSSMKEAIRAMKTGAESFCYRGRIKHKDGEYRWVEAVFQVYGAPLKKRSVGYAVTMRDITPQKKQEELFALAARKLSEDATHDELTRLPNRRLFNQALAKEMNAQALSLSSTSLMMLDIDRFKQYNDTYGHLAGDDCLRRVAAALVQTLRKDSDVVARFGGEEFVVLLPMTNCEGATQVATMLLETIRSLRIPHAGSTKGILTISIGVACWQAGSTADAERLLEKADSALYRAKESGRDTYRLMQCGPEAAA